MLCSVRLVLSALAGGADAGGPQCAPAMGMSLGDSVVLEAPGVSTSEAAEGLAALFKGRAAYKLHKLRVREKGAGGAARRRMHCTRSTM